MQDRIWALKTRAKELEVLAQETVRAYKNRGGDEHSCSMDYIQMRQIAGIIEYSRMSLLNDLENSAISEETLDYYETGFSELEPKVKGLANRIREELAQ